MLFIKLRECFNIMLIRRSNKIIYIAFEKPVLKPAFIIFRKS